MRRVNLGFRVEGCLDMSSSSADNDSGAEEETINGDTLAPGAQMNDSGTEEAVVPRILEILQEEKDAAPATPQQLGDDNNPYRAAAQKEDGVEDSSAEATPRRPGSPIGSLLSIPDDAASMHVG